MLVSSNCAGGQCTCKFDDKITIDWNKGAGGGFCFSADQMLTTPTGAVRMDQLKVGQQVLVLNEATGQAVFESVDSFIHRRDDIKTNFVRIDAENVHLTLSPEHLLPVVECGAGQSSNRLRYAKDALEGQCLLVRDGDHVHETPITAVGTTVNTGIYAPLTKSGTVLVNGVVASCYSKFEGYYVQNSFYRTLMQLQQLFAAAAAHSTIDPPAVLHLFETMTV